MRKTGFLCLHSPCFVALILFVIGDSRLSSWQISTVDAGRKLIRVAWGILLLTYIILASLVIVLGLECHRQYQDEVRVVMALLVSLKFLAVRLLYSMFVDVIVISVFPLTRGRFWMALWMEFFVVLMYTAAGITTPQSRHPKSANMFMRLRNTSSDGEDIMGEK